MNHLIERGFAKIQGAIEKGRKQRSRFYYKRTARQEIKNLVYIISAGPLACNDDFIPEVRLVAQ